VKEPTTNRSELKQNLTSQAGGVTPAVADLIDWKKAGVKPPFLTC